MHPLLVLPSNAHRMLCVPCPLVRRIVYQYSSHICRSQAQVRQKKPPMIPAFGQPTNLDVINIVGEHLMQRSCSGNWVRTLAEVKGRSGVSSSDDNFQSIISLTLEQNIAEASRNQQLCRSLQEIPAPIQRPAEASRWGMNWQNRITTDLGKMILGGSSGDGWVGPAPPPPPSGAELFKVPKAPKKILHLN